MNLRRKLRHLYGNDDFEPSLVSVQVATDQQKRSNARLTHLLELAKAQDLRYCAVHPSEFVELRESEDTDYIEFGDIEGFVLGVFADEALALGVVSFRSNAVGLECPCGGYVEQLINPFTERPKRGAVVAQCQACKAFFQRDA